MHKTQFLSKLRSRWTIPGVILIAGGIYLVIPKPPPPCNSLRQFGASEIQGRCVINRSNVTLQGNINRLPERLTIRGNLTISGTYITELPNAMVVEGGLFLYKTSIAKLPADLQVGRSFDQYSGFGSPGVRCDAIPKTVVIKGTRRCHS